MSDSDSEANVSLTEEQIEEQLEQLNAKILSVFMKYDTEHTDYMPSKDFKLAMEDMGETINEKQCFNMMMQADPQNSGKIAFEDFKDMILRKKEDEKGSSEQELLDAFIAMGGEEDGGGCIDADKLIQIIKHDFQMTIDIEALIEEIDEDGSGEIELDEFKALLQGGEGTDDPTEMEAEGDDD